MYPQAFGSQSNRLGLPGSCSQLTVIFLPFCPTVPALWGIGHEGSQSLGAFAINLPVLLLVAAKGFYGLRLSWE